MTRAKAENRQYQSLIEESGFRFINFPLIQTIPLDFDFTEENLKADWFFFTSVTTVRFFFEKISPRRINARIAAIGEKTCAELRKNGLTVHFQPSKFETSIFLEEWLNAFPAPSKIYFPQSALGKDEIKNQLTALGYQIDVQPIYTTITPNDAKQNKAKLLVEQNPIITFASPSAWAHFLSLFQSEMTHFQIGSIGPVTTKAIEKSGYSVHFEPDRYTMTDLLRKIIEETN
ncbi:uroporphyrinogen-III synthase [Listeria costaricensis]|uniref:uroporphyrinogen-III synthase n=1 Tax=Listeria costaricensis TaxID=2026604 RepID=UPI0013C52230|nr:uroporphyrinogen-III synthase [Listeria costaricensis]